MRSIRRYQLVALLIFSLILRIVFTYQHLSNPSYFIQQDRYADYADAMTNNSLHTTFLDGNKRLFPGYPFLIYFFDFFIPSSIISGLTISIIASILVIYLMWKLTGDFLTTFLSALFPPMWVEQGTEVANEPLFVLVSLLSLMSFMKRKYLLTGLLLGIAFIIRPIALSLGFAFLFTLVRRKQLSDLARMTICFFLWVGILLVFNRTQFGSDEILQQFMHSERYGGLRLGFIQIIHDFYRTLDWGQYKIFLSGFFYVSTNLFALVILFIYRKQTAYISLLFYWMLFSLLFIFTFSPFTLLDDFGRYALACFPAYSIGLRLSLNTARIRYWVMKLAPNRSPEKDE